MSNQCHSRRYAVAPSDLPRLARQLGFVHLSRHIADFPRGIAGRRFTRLLARAAAAGEHKPHRGGLCPRATRLGSTRVVLMTTADGPRHLIRSARTVVIAGELRGSAEPEREAEAYLDSLIG